MDEVLNMEGAGPETAAPEFTFSQLCRFKCFSWMEKCVLSAVLEGKKTYTIAEAQAAIAEFMKKEVV